MMGLVLVEAGVVSCDGSVEGQGGFGAGRRARKRNGLVVNGERLVGRVRMYVGIAKGVEILRLAPADWGHRLVRRFALGLVAFF